MVFPLASRRKPGRASLGFGNIVPMWFLDLKDPLILYMKNIL